MTTEKKRRQTIMNEQRIRKKGDTHSHTMYSTEEKKKRAMTITMQEKKKKKRKNESI